MGKKERPGVKMHGLQRKEGVADRLRWDRVSALGQG